MLKPQLTDYGITREEVEKYEQQQDAYAIFQKNSKRALLRAFLVDGVIFALLGIVLGLLYFIGGNIDWVVYGSIFFACGFVLLVLWIAFKNKKEVYKSRRGLIIDAELEATCGPYIREMDKYREYIRFINLAYWKNLHESDFEREILDLLKRNDYIVSLTTSNNIIVKKGDDEIILGWISPKTYASKLDILTFESRFSVGRNAKEAIFISVLGYVFDRNNSEGRRLISRAAQRGVKLKLWCIDEILDLAYKGGVLIYDGEVVVNGDSVEEGTHGLYIDTSPINPVDMKVGQCVMHRDLGVGVIVEIFWGEKYMTVKFTDDINNEFKKNFTIPESFDKGILTLI